MKDEPVGFDERIEPSGSVRKGGSGKLSVIEGNGGVESVGGPEVERPSGGLEIVGSGGLEIVAIVGVEIVGLGGLETVAFGGLEMLASNGFDNVGFGGLEIVGLGGAEIVASGGLDKPLDGKMSDDCAAMPALAANAAMAAHDDVALIADLLVRCSLACFLVGTKRRAERFRPASPTSWVHQPIFGWAARCAAQT